MPKFDYLLHLESGSTVHIDLVEELCSIRSDWKREDFVNAYEDEWEEIPDDITECHEIMKEYIYKTYDTSLIEELINDNVMCDTCGLSINMCLSCECPNDCKCLVLCEQENGGRCPFHFYDE